MVKAAIPLVQSSETSFHADLACHVCALADTAKTLRAEVERLRKALQEIAGFDGVLDYKRGWDAAEVAQAALDAGEGKG